MVASYVSDGQLATNLHLLACVKANEISGVNEAIEEGADVNFANLQEPINLQTPLRAACGLANTKMARLLLKETANVFAHFALDGWTALHSACYSGHDHLAQLLIELRLFQNAFNVYDVARENEICSSLAQLPSSCAGRGFKFT